MYNVLYGKIPLQYDQNSRDERPVAIEVYADAGEDTLGVDGADGVDTSPGSPVLR